MSDFADQFRRMIGRFATGVAVVLTDVKGEPGGMTVNSLTSVSLDPLLLLFCVRNESRWLNTLTENRKFTINVLAHAQQRVSQHFAGKPEHNRPACEFQDGFVWLAGANAVFCCELEADYPGGDHCILVGRVVSTSGPDMSDRPLLFHEGKYASIEMPQMSLAE